MSERKPAHRLGVLDGLRGIAILLVVWFHVWQISWLPAPLPALQFLPESGFLGVDIFFFLSGFVISYPFVRARIEGRAAPGWGHFALRRAAKIVPSYLLAIAAAYVTGYAATQGGGNVAQDVVTHLFFIHNWFASTYGSINGVLWTLAVEVQFYCVFPLLAVPFLRRPYLTCGAMIAAALAYRLAVTHAPDTYYAGQLIEQLPGYLDCFGSGMLAAWLYVRLRDHPAVADDAARRWAATAIALAGFLALGVLFQTFFAMRYENDAFIHWKTVHRTWLALDCIAVAVGSLFAWRAWRAALANPVLLFFAYISYNWYIYHQFVARELFAHRIPPWNGNDPHFDPGWQYAFSAVAFVASIAVAALVTYGFERPLLRWISADRKPFDGAGNLVRRLDR